MTNLVRLGPDRVEFPYHGYRSSIAPAFPNLQDGLAAFQHLKEDLSLQSLTLAKREEATRFLRQFGELLLRTAFPEESLARLDPRAPLLLELAPEWQPYPWELLHDGSGWLAQERGVVRYVAPPAQPEPEPPRGGGPLRVLALSAHPLAHEEDGVAAAQARHLGARFISTVGMLLDPPERGAAGFEVRALEHASREVLENALARAPELLYFTGFSEKDGWFMESDRLRPEVAGREWLAAHLGAAVRAGLRGLVLNDSLGLVQAGAGAEQAESFFRAGLPALIRIDGRQARMREQDYLRTLVRVLAGGGTMLAGHLAGIRRLSRRFAESWDWSFVKLFLRALPETRGNVVRYELPDVAPARNGQGEMAAGGGFALMPPPPVFCGRRRFFGREQELEALAEALRTEPAGASPLVFLSGPAGCGKTAMALEVARRIHRRYMQVVYLHGRDLLPAPPALAAPLGWTGSGGPPAMALWDGLARHLQVAPPAGGGAELHEEALAGELGAGPPRLIILDGLEQHPGYYGFCKGLEKFPTTCRVLVISRSKPPLLTGPHFDLEALGAHALAGVFHESLVERMTTHPQGELLLRVCGRDLQVARMLWRLRGWPAPQSMGPLLAETARDAGRAGSPDLLELVLQAVLAELSRDALSVLQTLSLFTYLVHQEVLSHLTELDGKRLGQALAELQWAGLVDAYGNDRYFALQLRLQAMVARRLVDGAAYARLRPALLRTYESYLATTQTRMEGTAHPGTASPSQLLAWGEPPPGAADLAQTRALHRLGLERINLAELAVILAEEEDWAALARFAATAAFLQGVHGMDDLMTLLYRLLLAAGRAEHDTVMQATALMGLARPLVDGGRAAEAQPLLEKALELLGHNPGWEELAQAYLLLSRCYEGLNREEAAINMLHAAEELARQLGNPDGIAEAAAALARIWAGREENPEQAERLLEQSIRRLEQGGHPFSAARLKLQLGELCAEAGRLEQARALLEAALRAFQDRGREAEAHQALLRMAELHLAEGLPDEALDAFMQARAAGERGGDAILEDRVLGRICKLFEQHERYEEALNGYLLLRRMREARGDREGLLRVLDTIGGLYFQLGEQANSTRFYEESLQLKETIPQA